MEYKRISVNGVSYGETKKGAKNYLENLQKFPKVTNVDFRDRNFFDILENSIRFLI